MERDMSREPEWDEVAQRDRYYTKPPRFCACDKCADCRRDGKQGLCIFELFEDDNAICGDCRDYRCK